MEDVLSGNQVTEILATIFSAVLLTAVAVIISGKLVAATASRTGRADDFFVVNLRIFKITANGDEVVWGFALFIISMGLTVSLGGRQAHAFFNESTGLNIGQWSSLCAIAAFFCVIASVLLWIAIPFLRPRPIISQEDRTRQVQLLQQQRIQNEEGDDF